MSDKSIRINVLADVVADAPRVFATKDISGDRRMLAAHPDLALHRHYQSCVNNSIILSIASDAARMLASRHVTTPSL